RSTLRSFPTRRSSDLTVFGAIGMFLLLIGTWASIAVVRLTTAWRPVIYRLEVSYLLLVTAGLLLCLSAHFARRRDWRATAIAARSEEHTSELQSRENL